MTSDCHGLFVLEQIITCKILLIHFTHIKRLLLTYYFTNYKSILANLLLSNSYSFKYNKIFFKYFSLCSTSFDKD